MWVLLAQSMPSQVGPEQIGLWIFCLVAVIGVIAGSLGVIILWQRVTEKTPKAIVVTLEVLEDKLREVKTELTSRFESFEQKLTSQLAKMEIHEDKLDEFKHETRQLVLESNHKIELQLSKLADSSQRLENTDLSIFVKREEFETQTLEFKDHRAYTHTQIHDIRDFLQELRMKLEVLIALGQGRQISLIQSNPDFKLPPEVGGK